MNGDDDLPSDLQAKASGRKQVEQELAEQTRALARSNADLEQFTYAVSHDLQEPLRMVTSFMELLNREYAEALDDRARTYIDYAVDGARRMQRLLDDLLEFSRLGRQTLELNVVAVEDVLRDVRADLKVQMEEKGAVIKHGTLPDVWGDQTLLRIVFQNLISNALKFSGDDPPQIEVTGRRQGHVVTIRVRDHGIGIDPKFAERIFEIFQRLHAREEIPGTGLGLALTRRAVRRLGGTIRLRETSGPGALFELELAAPP